MIGTQIRPVEIKFARKPSGRIWSPLCFGWVAAAFMPFMIAAGVIILVETNKGKLIIESDATGVSIEMSDRC